MGIREDIEKMENKMKEIENESWAMVVLKQNAKANKRMFVALMVVLAMWFITIGYLVYVLNDIGTIEDSDSIDIQDVEKTTLSVST